MQVVLVGASVKGFTDFTTVMEDELVYELQYCDWLLEG